MTNVIQKVVLTGAQYWIITLVARIFGMTVTAPVFNLIVVSGLIVYAVTRAFNVLLVRAIRHRQRALFRILLLLQANVSTKDSLGRTPLNHAIEANDEWILMVLLRHPKVRINVTDRKGVSPVMQAISSSKLSLKVKEMFCNHPDFNIFFTGLHSAVPVVPSLLLEIKSRDAQGDRQLEVLLRMKLRAAMEYLTSGEVALRKSQRHHGLPPPRDDATRANGSVTDFMQGEVVFLK